MVIIKVLKRKDAASVIVAVVLAMIVAGFVSSVTTDLAQLLAGLKNETSSDYVGAGDGWQVTYLFPAIFALLQVLALELLSRLYGLVKDASNQK